MPWLTWVGLLQPGSTTHQRIRHSPKVFVLNYSGTHGYDIHHPDMHAIFLAHGKRIKNTRINEFSNVNVYGVLTRLLGIRGLPYNGTDALANSIIL